MARNQAPMMRALRSSAGVGACRPPDQLEHGQCGLGSAVALQCWITVGLLRDVRLWRRPKMDAQKVGEERL
jgi:hypothetical protein